MSGRADRVVNGRAGALAGAASTAAAAAVAALAVAGCTSSYPDLQLVQPPDPPSEAFEVFDKYVEFQNLGLYGTPAVSDDALLHAANVLAGYLDSDEDGQLDSVAAYEHLWEAGATMVLFGAEGDDEARAFLAAELPDHVAVEPLYAADVHPGGADEGLFDATLDHVLRLVTAQGFARAFPDTFGEAEGSTIAQLMDAAIEAGYYDPSVADAEMPYGEQVRGYTCWALTSILGAQDFPGRPAAIEDEWALFTAELVREHAAATYTLLTHPQWGLPSVLPDGDYDFTSGST